MMTPLISFYHNQIGKYVKETYLNENVNNKRHKLLAKYFYQKADPCNDSSWKGEYSHPFYELPFQQTQAEMWEDSENTLIDLRFIDTKCKYNMLFDLIEDLNNLIIKNKTDSLLNVIKAVKFNISTILERQELTKQGLYNYLFWIENIDLKLNNNLDNAYSDLEKMPYWIKAEAPLPESETFSNISISFKKPSHFQALSYCNDLIAVATPIGETEVYSLQTGASLHKEKFDQGKVIAVLIGKDSTDLAYLNNYGNIFYKNIKSPFLVRTNENIITNHLKHGIVTVQKDNSLISWKENENVSKIIDTNLPIPLISLKISSDGKMILYVAGNKDQKIVFLRFKNKNWIKRNYFILRGSNNRCRL